MKKPELLAPAGDMTRLMYAIEYGADAVYIGGEEYSLRTASANFSREEMVEAVKYAHAHGVRLYVACNAVPHNDEVADLPDYVAFLKKIGVDAVICSDLGTFAVVRRVAPRMAVHISTQANVTNYEACLMWYKLGARRIVLARELTLDEITDIRASVPEDLELEAFVHGALCMAHSGRCLISNFLTSRDSNRGRCTQPCRWKYALCEEKRPGKYFPVEQTDTGTFFLNCKDLCMIDHVPDLCNAGVNSLKIEGRAKSEYYVACVTNAYRHALDDCFEDLDRFTTNISAYAAETEKVSHRPYGTGFYYGDPLDEGMAYEDGGYERDWEVVAVVDRYDPLTKSMIVHQHNKFKVADEVEILEADRPVSKMVISAMYDESGAEILAAPHADEIVRIPVDHYVGSMSFLRRRKGT